MFTIREQVNKYEVHNPVHTFIFKDNYAFAQVRLYTLSADVRAREF